MRSRRLGNQNPTFEAVGEYATTMGPQLVGMYERWGAKFYPCQARELELFAARDEDGRYASKTISISKPRQNGKSFGARKYSLAMAAAGKVVLYSAHNGDTVRKMFKFIKDEIEANPKLMARIKPRDGIYKAKGSEGIYFANGGMIEFQTRTDSGTRGGTYDVIIIDEAQELTYDQLDAIKPTTLASDSGDPQMIYIGTPPGPKCRGDVFRDQHDNAHAGNNGSAWWMEWSAEMVPNMRDREAVLDLAYQTNPAMGYRIREDVMLDAIDSYQNKPDSFAREYLGWWSPIAKVNAAIDFGQWKECATDAPPDGGRVTYGVKFSTDGMYASIGVCAMEQKGLPHVEFVDYKNIAVDGLEWLAKFIYERRNRAAVTVIDGKSGSEDLINRLESMGMPKKAYIHAGSREYVAATSMLVNAVRERGVTHNGQEQLNDCVKTCSKRPIGTGGAFGFGGDCPEPVDAVALALWAMRTSKRDPTRKAQVW